ncbi:MAG: hypothetical protein ICV53_21625 [Flavisolibacter sp.]|nr:hypothetical protein [Flavisolibacter sp.]MBD0368693.1 hypothetical protein [Flavisolibacter sp.]
MAENHVRIFITSSSELRQERKQCVLLINQLNKSHKHLHLEPVEWEYDLVHANYPGHKNIQGAITPLLLESHLIIFIFYSKIGSYTRQEFDETTKAGKRLFAFLKRAFHLIKIPYQLTANYWTLKKA